MCLRPSPRAKYLLCAFFLCLCTRAVTLDELQQFPGLTPRLFATFFSQFEFKYHNDVQPPEIFLASRSGDCDDYATLAATVLSTRGYTPRLVAVRMPKVVHVVCYIEEERCFLDYNNRSSAAGTIASGSSIDEIANSVAQAYGLKWNSASEFTFDGKAKRLVQTVLAHEARQIAGLVR